MTAVWLACLFSVFIPFSRKWPAILIVPMLGALPLLWLAEVSAETLRLAVPPGMSDVVIALTAAMVLLSVSPLLDRAASLIFAEPPRLDAFDAIALSPIHLAGGIVIAWVLGGFIEEILLRGVILSTVLEAGLPFPGGVVNAFAVSVAAIAGGLAHYYQGPRAMLIITMLSMAFGGVFVLSGSLWAVILCHGMYDTFAFVLHARRLRRAGRGVQADH